MGCSLITKIPKVTLDSETHVIRSVNDVVLKPGFFVQERLENFEDHYRMGELLNMDSVKQIRCCFHRETGTKRAVTVFQKDKVTSTQTVARIFKEIEITTALDHPHIIRIYDYFEDISKLYIVREFCRGGELFQTISKQQSFSEEQAAYIMSQLFSAVAYLHSKGITHRNIKPENLLLEDSSLNIKLVNFLHSAVLQQDHLLATGCGTAYYIAPEVLQQKYTAKCDLWSCGVILYILLAGYPPFNGQTDDEIISNVEKGQYSLSSEPWPRVSKEAKDLILRLLVREQQRLSAEHSLLHPWIVKNSSHDTNTSVYSFALENLRHFQASAKFAEAVSMYIVVYYTGLEETKELRAVFKSLDTNGDGRVARDELANALLHSLEGEDPEEQISRILSAVDSDKDGFIEYSEFLKVTMDSKKLLSQSNLKMAFDFFDRDSNGKISATEIKTILEGSRHSEDHVWEDIISEVNQNGNGEIDLQEFCKIIMNTAQ